MQIVLKEILLIEQFFLSAAVEEDCFAGDDFPTSERFIFKDCFLFKSARVLRTQKSNSPRFSKTKTKIKKTTKKYPHRSFIFIN